MSVKPQVGPGQESSPPAGKAIGFVDSQEQFDAVTNVLEKAGYARSMLVVLRGEPGLDLLEQLQETFHFGDGEDAIMELAKKELELGHYAMGIEAKDRDDALKIIGISEPLGAHSFSYFGRWVNERLTR